MKGTGGRLARVFLQYAGKTILLLLAVSIISFVLVSNSPVVHMLCSPVLG